MKNIKKYKNFEANDWGTSDDFGDWKKDQEEWDRVSSFRPTTTSTGVGGYSEYLYDTSGEDFWWKKPLQKKEEEPKKEIDNEKLYPINKYNKYILIGDHVYHKVWGWGKIRSIRSMFGGIHIFEIGFAHAQIEIIKSDSTTDHLEILGDLIYFIQKYRMSEEDKSRQKQPEKKPEKEVDIKTKYEELRRRYDSTRDELSKLRYDKEKYAKETTDLRKYISKIQNENEKLKKQLGEYEGLKKAMEEFKGKIDPFGEETWSVKKGK